MNATTEIHHWSGVADVIPRAGNDLLGEASGAYVGVVGVANSESTFLANAKAAFSAMDFDLLDLSDVELIRSLKQWTNADPSMREKLTTLSAENPIGCGSFHVYRE